MQSSLLKNKKGFLDIKNMKANKKPHKEFGQSSQKKTSQKVKQKG